MTDNADEQDGSMTYGLDAHEHQRLRRLLRELPEATPPRAVWQRIEEQGRAEGLLSRRPLFSPAAWSAGAGLAAAVVLAVLVLPAAPEPEVFPTEPDYVEQASSVNLKTLNALMVESRQLEQDLRSLPGEPQVVRAGTVATIAAVEDQIAAIDYRLNHMPVRTSPEQMEIYWRERVRLMNLLVQLRSAQAQRSVF
jgi:hypothetical protein